MVVIGRGKEHRKILDETRMHDSTTLTYDLHLEDAAKKLRKRYEEDKTGYGESEKNDVILLKDF